MDKLIQKRETQMRNKLIQSLKNTKETRKLTDQNPIKITLIQLLVQNIIDLIKCFQKVENILMKFKIMVLEIISETEKKI
jgi:hypothetical protein